MRLSLLAVVLCIAALSYVSASSSFDDFAREQLWDELEEENEEAKRELFEDEMERRSATVDKSYLTAQKHPERLRLCVKCVGEQRGRGQNVKQATTYCNSVCKRALFDTRSLLENDLYEQN